MLKPTIIIKDRDSKRHDDSFHVTVQQEVSKTQETQYLSTDYTVSIQALQACENVFVSLDFVFDDWKKDNYVLAPAAAYNGNKFKSEKLEYPPLPFDVVEKTKNPEIVITDVPRLNKEQGISKMELLVGDLSNPVMSFYSPQDHKAVFIKFEQQSIPSMDNGLVIEETQDKKESTFSLLVPGVREYKYYFMSTDNKGDDDCYSFSQGETVTVKLRTYDLQCSSMIEYFQIYFDIRKDFLPPALFENVLPFSKAFQLVENKYNLYNWECNHGFYRSSVAENNVCGQWQTGWVGGGMSTYPCFVAGTRLSKERSYQTLEFVFDKIMASSGIFYGMFYQGEVYGDAINFNGDKNILLTRKFVDAVYFILKQFFVFQEKEVELPEKWTSGIQRSLDALVEIFEKNNQFGQFSNVATKEIVVYGTSSAAMGIAALALGYAFYQKDEYLKTAEAAGHYYFDNFLLKGISNGGPGEICQCMDSESSFALLESYVALYEVTNDVKWIPFAKHAAHFASTFCVSYDFKFPAGSQFQERQVNSTGAVWASIQNKHAGPGICTLSGVSLFKLFRATRDVKYLELFKEISHNLTQYVSTKENPIKGSYGREFNYQYSPPGFVGERVNLSDWEGKINVGETPGGSCWCEVSVMLNYVENPGLYVIIDTEEIYNFDHVDYEIVEKNNDFIELNLINRTPYDSFVNLFHENTKTLDSVLNHNPWYNYTSIYVPKEQSIPIRIYKN